jgi:hypothetical protein
MNYLGVAYYSVTWPHHIYCARVENECDPIAERMPDWISKAIFTFKDGE